MLGRSIEPGSLPLNRRMWVLRIFWLGLLLGQAIFLLVLLLAILPHERPMTPQPALIWVGAGMLVTMVPLAFVVRTLMFAGGRSAWGIAFGSYTAGNIVFWAVCDGASFVGMIAAMINGSLWPSILITAFAVGLQIVTPPLASKVRQ